MLPTATNHPSIPQAKTWGKQAFGLLVRVPVHRPAFCFLGDGSGSCHPQGRLGLSARLPASAFVGIWEVNHGMGALCPFRVSHGHFFRKFKAALKKANPKPFIPKKVLSIAALTCRHRHTTNHRETGHEPEVTSHLRIKRQDLLLYDWLLSRKQTSPRCRMPQYSHELSAPGPRILCTWLPHRASSSALPSFRHSSNNTHLGY